MAGEVEREVPERPGTVTSARVTAVRGGQALERADRLATEEPMEIQVRGPGQEAESVAVTMRTPGHDFELAAGFLFTEGLIHSAHQIESVKYCDTDVPEQLYNVVTVILTEAFDPGTFKRNFYATSSCGVCGKASIDQVQVSCAPLAPGPVLGASVLSRLPDELRKAQRVFDQTGGLHACGLFDARGALVSVREDVGRHNALDKLVGQMLLEERLPLSARVLQVSGRVSFEIVQKAAMAGVPIVAAVSAPSSLAVSSARELGMTLVGFSRGDRFNMYTHEERIDLAS
ncbi:MAG TPA: formate dehydrogenase accessory sulfurtransferase FdhD [Actinomycetota bacterium]|nr:formate dehydrogenase accessory sulfurtransferase FdhD [Actinomycetota bacterium]